MYKRHIGAVLASEASKMPAVTVVGARQSGKTTLVRTHFSDHKYISLDSLVESLSEESMACLGSSQTLSIPDLTRHDAPTVLRINNDEGQRGAGLGRGTFLAQSRCCRRGQRGEAFPGIGGGRNDTRANRAGEAPRPGVQARRVRRDTASLRSFARYGLQWLYL